MRVFWLISVIVAALPLLFEGVANAASAINPQEHTIYVKNALHADSLSNIYINYGSSLIAGNFTLSYSFYNNKSTAAVPSGHEIAQFEINDHSKPDKFVWYVPDEATSGCFFARNSSGSIVAQSVPYKITERHQKPNHPQLSDLYFDAVKYFKNNRISQRMDASDKNRKIAIVGAGVSGLYSGYLLEQVGFSQFDILEAGDRVGGRLCTTHFDNSTTLYQEMGGMRIPEKQELKGEMLPIPDHQIVFQLVKDLNTINNDFQQIEFIEWYESRANNLYYRNGHRLQNGKIPTIGEFKTNSSIIPSDKSKRTAGNDWKWLQSTNKSSSSSPTEIWEDIHDVLLHGGKTTTTTQWKTIQGGMSRLSQAFMSLLGKKIVFGTRVSKLEYNDAMVSVQWKTAPSDTSYISNRYDNVIVAVPFSVVRTWHLPQLNRTLHQAIHHLRYNQACKVALSFSKRFWEHLERPIQGGCDDTDLLSGTTCYPVNDIGSDGPGVVLASYASGDMGLHFASMTEEGHVARVLEDFTELHGELVTEYYTGEYRRHCWILDPLQSGSTAAPRPGQNKLYMPSYFNIDQGLIFIGEHTDAKHGWISSALNSAIRGVVMILVENGHIDEAKMLIDKYDVKWLNI